MYFFNNFFEPYFFFEISSIRIQLMDMIIHKARLEAHRMPAEGARRVLANFPQNPKTQNKTPKNEDGNEFKWVFE